MNSTNENGPERRGNDDTGPGQRLDYEGEALMGNIQAGTTDSPFEPGAGWREVSVERPAGAEQRIVELDPDGTIVRGWVREKQVAALPNEPYTVIRVTWAGTRVDSLFVLYEDKMWRDQSASAHRPESLQGYTSFQVLSEPRDVTAKAVLEMAYVRIQGDGKVPGLALSDIAREFGVGA